MSTKSDNNGGSTDYYKLNRKWKECGDIIEDRVMNYNQGNIFKVAFTFNVGRHSATSYERELNKIIWFANRELERIKREKLLFDVKCKAPSAPSVANFNKEGNCKICGEGILTCLCSEEHD